MKNIIVLAKCGNGYCGCDSEKMYFSLMQIVTNQKSKK